MCTEQIHKNMSSNINNTTCATTMEPLYQIGDIVIATIDGVVRKRHVCGTPYKEKCKSGKEAWIYPVDYGLGLTSEGVITEGQIIRKSKSGPPSEGGDDNICL